MNRIRNRKTNALAMTIALALAAGSMAGALEAQPQQTAAIIYDIPDGDLWQGLIQFARQSELQLLVDPPGLTTGLRTPAVGGSYTARQALERMLYGKGLVYEFVGDDSVVIRKPVVIRKKEAPPPTDERPAASQTSSEATELEAITVTGTRLRGGVTPSPTIVIDQQKFQQEGFTDLGDVIRTIPQNFRGGQNPGVTSGSSTGNQSNQNLAGGSALNLRGLGPDATVTLLNGRRLSYSGVHQAVDISAIPIEAVSRLDVVPDGASAIYGSDAVGGVANVILRRDFEGVTLGTRYGDTSDGGLTRHEYTATAGATWESGGLIATYKKADQDPVYADQRRYTEYMDDPTTLYQGSSFRSGLLSAHQFIGDHAELRLDALRTVREATSYLSYPGIITKNTRDATITLIAPSLTVNLPGDWALTTSASRGREEAIAEGATVSDAGTQITLNCYCNETENWELGAEGPLVQFGMRQARLAFGFGGRMDEFFNRSYSSGTVQGGDQHSRYAYAEVSVPVIGADNARPGLERLEFSAAVRSEDYDSFGSVITPKFGVIYDPGRDITIRATLGRSFKAPTLSQQYFNRQAYLMRAQDMGCASCAADETVLMSYGGNAELSPERARTWTVSLAFHPDAIPGLETELSYFDIDYTGRIIQPISNSSQALSNPVYAPFVHYNPTVSQQQQLITEYSTSFTNYAQAGYDPQKVIAIASGQYTNAARQHARGVDASGSYRFDLASGKMEVRGSASWIDLTQQSSAGQPSFDLSGQIFYPARLNGRFGAVWSQGGLNVSAFANHTSGVTNTLTGRLEKTASFTTIDTTVRYQTAAGDSPFAGVVLAVSVNNLLDRGPPYSTPRASQYVPYDSTNYSAIGREFSVSMSKHW